MKCDLHVHTIHSGLCTVPVARRFCRESYSDPKEVHAKLKRLGMDLVTITDHDSIGAAEVLRHHPDFFVSEEITCRMPSGAAAHVAVYDIDEHQHVEAQRRRDDLPALLSFFAEQRLLFSVNHVFSGLTGRRDASDYEWFERAFPCMETLNGAMVSRANELAAQFAGLNGKSMIGGSDAHTLAGLGGAYTVVPDARTKEEFLKGVRSGRSVAVGESGSYAKLTRDVLRICVELLREKPALVLLSPLIGGVPLVLFVNYWLEVAFAERWFNHATGGSPGRRKGTSLEPGEVSA